MPGIGNIITQADMDALAALANTKLLPLVNAAIAANQNGWRDGMWGFSSSNVLQFFNGQNIYDRHGAVDGSYNAYILNPQPDYLFDPAVRNWMSEFNRIRGDLMAMVFQSFTGAEALYQNAATLVSGPWCVGLNDPDTYLIASGGDSVNGVDYFAYFQGLLNGGNESPLFKSVKFYSQEESISISSCRRLYAAYHVPYQTNFNFDFTYNPDSFGHWKCRMFCLVTGSTTPPLISGFTITDTSSVTIDWTVEATTIAGQFLFVGTIDEDISTSGSITIAATPPAGYSFSKYVFSEDTGFPFTLIPYLTIDSFLVFSVAAGLAATPGIVSEGVVNVTNCQDVPEVSKFSVAGFGSMVAWVVSDPSIKGVWAANTLPVPGINFYLDQDMPPYVGAKLPNALNTGRTVAIAKNNFDLYNESLVPTITLASTMREPEKFETGIGPTNIINQSLQTRPAPYQILKATDLVPFDYGFNSGYDFVATPRQIVGASGGLAYHGVSVPDNVTSVRIRLVAVNTGVKNWKNGVLQYGELLGVNLKIFVSSFGYPDPNNPATYDFFTTSNEVNIPSDGGAGYLAGILNSGIAITIQNNTGADVLFDFISEVVFSWAKPRQYFPDCLECFSYSIDGAPAIQHPDPNDPANNDNNYKPVPQNGHCLYKLRATRLPVDNGHGIAITPSSGDEIVAYLGTNKLQPDNTLLFIALGASDPGGLGAGDTGFGSGDDGMGAGGPPEFVYPFKITIPASARDSGDVAVFWPVLGGTELVYKCVGDIILEAWANWQPIFFNNVFGIGYDPVNITQHGAAPAATAFQYAMNFANYYDKSLSNYPPDYFSVGFSPGYLPLSVQYPLSIELYNDLMALLNLL